MRVSGDLVPQLGTERPHAERAGEPWPRRFRGVRWGRHEPVAGTGATKSGTFEHRRWPVSVTIHSTKSDPRARASSTASARVAARSAHISTRAAAVARAFL